MQSNGAIHDSDKLTDEQKASPDFVPIPNADLPRLKKANMRTRRKWFAKQPNAGLGAAEKWGTLVKTEASRG